MELRVVDGRREIWSTKSQKWIDCPNPPEVPCPKCGQEHCYHEAEAFWLWGLTTRAGGGGTLDEVDMGGRGLREAVQTSLDAIKSEPGHWWLSAAAHALEESTRKGYAAALWKLRKRSRKQFGASPRQLPELEIKEMVARANSEGNLTNLLSVCGQLDKLRLHPRIAETGDWQVVKWLAKRRVRGEFTLVRWALMELFVWLAEQVMDLASAEVVALACISVSCLLRVGEAATVRTSAREDVTFNGEKGRPSIRDVEVGPWTKWWALFL